MNRLEEGKKRSRKAIKRSRRETMRLGPGVVEMEEEKTGCICKALGTESTQLLDGLNINVKKVRGVKCNL